MFDYRRKSKVSDRFLNDTQGRVLCNAYNGIKLLKEAEVIRGIENNEFVRRTV
jgi:hypothetical protein